MSDSHNSPNSAPAVPESPEPHPSQVQNSEVSSIPVNQLSSNAMVIVCNHPRPDTRLPCADCGEKLGII